MLDSFAAASFEAAARHFEPAPRRWDTPGDLALTIQPPRWNPRTRRTDGTIQTPALDLIDAELVRLLDEPDGRVIISIPPQEGKSTRVAQIFPIWALTHDPELRIVTGSYAQGLANRNGRTVRNLIGSHPELGLSIADDNGAVSEWQIAGHRGGMISVGRGAGITGRPADLMIIDDPIKDRAEADSQTIRDTCWDWWTDSLSSRLSPGAPVVLILTRWHQDDLAGRLIERDGHAGWRVLNIPAQADHDPAKGETDPLDREPGQYLESAQRRTLAQWELRRKTAGAQTWASLYQGRPSPESGDILQRDWWQRYTQPLWLVRDDGAHVVSDRDPQLIMSWDMTFTDKKTSDFVVGQVWLRRGADAYLLDQVRGRWDFPETIRRFRALCAKWPQASLKIVEDKANGPAVIAQLRHEIPGIVPEQVSDSKVARTRAVSPLVEAKNVWLPSADLAPWADELIEEAAAFPNGAHDDQVDALTQALNRLLITPLVEESHADPAADMWDAYDATGYYATPY